MVFSLFFDPSAWEPRAFVSAVFESTHPALAGGFCVETDEERGSRRPGAGTGCAAPSPISGASAHRNSSAAAASPLAVEESFRITKRDLQARPVFRWTERCIRAHLVIAFVACACGRHLARRVMIRNRPKSPSVIRVALTEKQCPALRDPENGRRFVILSKPREEAYAIYGGLGLALSGRPCLLTAVGNEMKSGSGGIHRVPDAVPNSKGQSFKINAFRKKPSGPARFPRQMAKKVRSVDTGGERLLIADAQSP